MHHTHARIALPIAMYVKTTKHVHSDRDILFYRAASDYVRRVLKCFYPIEWKFVVMEKTWGSWNVMTGIWRIEMVEVKID